MRRAGWIVIVVVLSFAVVLMGQIPQVISFQGRLTDDSGIPLPDTTYDITFSLYTSATGGTPIWRETQSISTVDGLYTVLLGSVTVFPSSIDWNESYYLGVRMGTSPEMTPRYRVATSPYAFRADEANSVNWDDIADMPAGFADGVDDEGAGGATYTAGDGIDITDTIISVADDGITEDKIGDAAVTGDKIAQMGAASGQVLKWDGTIWTPANDSVGAGGGSVGALNDLTDVSAPSPAVGEIIKWNGTAWVNSPDATGGGAVGSLSDVLSVGNSAGINDINMNDNAILNIDWTSSDDGAGSELDADYLDAHDGSYYLDWANLTDVPVDIADGDDYMSGETAGGDLVGTYPNPTLASHGAASGQVLKWNGTSWVAANDSVGAGAAGISGGGTQNYVPKFTNAAGDQIGDSHISDNVSVDVSTSVNISHSGQVGLRCDGTDAAWASIYVNAQNASADPGYGYLRGGLLFGYTYLNSAHTWIVSNGGWGGSTDNLVVDTLGNVGIGTTSPNNKLEINGTGSGLRFTNLTSASPAGPAGTKVLSVDANGDVILVTDATGGGGSDGDWTISGTNMYSGVTGNIGIGTTTPTAALHLSYAGDGMTSEAAIMTQGDDDIYLSLLFRDEDTGHDYEILGHDGIDFSVDGSDAMTIANDGKVGIGTTSPEDPLYVKHTVISHSADDSPTITGFVTDGADTMIGILAGENGYQGVYGYTSRRNGYGVYGMATGSLHAYGVYGRAHGSGTNYAIYGIASGGTTNWAGYFAGDVNITGNLTAGSIPTAGGWTDGGANVYLTTSTDNVGIGTTSPEDPLYVKHTVTSHSASNSPTITGFVTDGADSMIGTLAGENGYQGVYGYTSRHNGYGVYGVARGSLHAYGVSGYALGTGTNYGIYGAASGGATNWAGYFSGDVNVTGSVSKGGGSFLIDHPLDPLHKTLRHNFVESPENLCLYRGKIELSDNGTAIVTMPDYFAALTKEDEATVVLTPIGRTPFLASYEWNSDFTAFTVYGNPNGKVSYQVLADRDDPVMHKLYHPIVETKGDGNGWTPGKLLYPKAYGYPETMGQDYDLNHN